MNKQLAVWVVAYMTVAMVQARPALQVDSVSREIQEYNGVQYTLLLHRDNDGMPSHYQAHIFTPVCEDDICKPVYIDLHWDLLGNFLRYEVPVNEPLTKMDHVEFDREEYRKLQEILTDSNSLLKDYRIEELVESAATVKPGGEVDAVTGATAKSLQTVVIPGALYTCYTLWHIAHGRVMDTIARTTDSLMTPHLMRDFLGSGNHHYQHYALDRVMDGDGRIEKGFDEAVLSLIASPNVFLALRILRSIDPHYLTGDSRQRPVAKLFVGANYRLQLALLEKFEAIPIGNELKDTLATYRSGTNEEIATKIEKILNK